MEKLIELIFLQDWAVIKIAVMCFMLISVALNQAIYRHLVRLNKKAEEHDIQFAKLETWKDAHEKQDDERHSSNQQQLWNLRNQ